MAVSIPAKMSSSISPIGRAVVCRRSRPSSPTRNRSSGEVRRGIRFQATYPATAKPKAIRAVHGLKTADQIEGRYDNVNDWIVGERLVFPVESVARMIIGPVEIGRASCREMVWRVEV